MFCFLCQVVNCYGESQGAEAYAYKRFTCHSCSYLGMFEETETHNLEKRLLPGCVPQVLLEVQNL